MWLLQVDGASQIFGGCGGGVSQNVKPVVITFVNCNETLKFQKFTTRTYWRLPNQKITKFLREFVYVISTQKSGKFDVLDLAKMLTRPACNLDI